MSNSSIPTEMAPLPPCQALEEDQKLIHRRVNLSAKTHLFLRSVAMGIIAHLPFLGGHVCARSKEYVTSSDSLVPYAGCYATSLGTITLSHWRYSAVVCQYQEERFLESQCQ